MSSCFSGSTSAISIGYKLKEKKSVEDSKLNRLNMKMFDDLNANPILI